MRPLPDRRAMGRPRGLHRPAGPAPSCSEVLDAGAAGNRRRRRPRSRAPTTVACDLTPVLPDIDKRRSELRAGPAAHPRSRSRRRDPDRVRDERRAAESRPRRPVPARSCPAWYAVASVKWLTRIDVVDRTVTPASSRPATTSRRVARPPARTRHPDARPCANHRSRHRVVAPAAHTRSGKGLVGHRHLSPASSVSFTGEGEWHPAQLEPAHRPLPLAGLVFQLEREQVGRHTLRARATDAAGNVQPEVPPWNRLGYGNNAVEVSYVDVG